MSSAGAVTLNLLAIDKIFDYFGIPMGEERLELYSQIQSISSSAISAQYREEERQRKLEAAKNRQGR